MEYSLIKEVNSKVLEAYILQKTFEPQSWPVFFPLKPTLFLSYETLIGSADHPVAADIVTYNVSAPEKTRKVVSRKTGEIPPIKIKRIMREKDINDYNIIKVQAASTKGNINAILDMVFNDVEFCVNGVNARLEWMCMQALSRGFITLSKTVNAGIVTQTDIDFGLPAANKRVIESATSTRVWNNGTAGNYLPITDIKDICEVAKTAGYTIKYVMMNYSKWLEFSKATEVIDFALPYTAYSIVRSATSGTTVAPNIESVNKALQSFKLPTIIVVDSYVTLEQEDHTKTATDVWLTASGEDKYVMFIPSIPLGNVLHGPIAEETNPPKQVTHVKRGHILVSKYSDVDPVKEVTVGQANAFPVWPSIDSCYRLDTEATPQADGLDN